MGFKDKALCKVRTITTFLVLSDDRATWQSAILGASQFCSDLSKQFLAEGYNVQSIRIVTNPFGEYLRTSTLEGAKQDLAYLNELLNTNNQSGLRIRFAIGEAITPEEIALLPALIKSYGDLCNACVNIPMDEFGVLENDLIYASVKAVLKISETTPRGEGNFNFTVNFNCDPLIPYFPASYHKRELGNCFVVGLETPDLLVHVLKTFNESNKEVNHNVSFKGYYDVMSEALNYHVANIKTVIDSFDNDMFHFSGLDSSAAPSKNCSSMVEVYKQLGVPYFGASGTVEASALLTKVFKSVKGIALVGFSGLMLAVTEDTGLAEGTIKKEFDIRALLTYSAVCGIGLDTVPIEGNTSAERICAVMRDTGTMAFKLNKPLTVRLFPVPGLQAGELTAFESDDLCNCAVMALP
jgi:uncharacterized protein (UPF0210 family)